MKILDALLLLKEQAVNGCVEEHRYGICHNLSGISEDSDTSYEFVMYNCKYWEHFSGSIAWPVKHTHNGGLWEGEQLELRLSLLDHLIIKAEQQGV